MGVIERSGVYAGIGYPPGDPPDVGSGGMVGGRGNAVAVGAAFSTAVVGVTPSDARMIVAGGGVKLSSLFSLHAARATSTKASKKSTRKLLTLVLPI